MNWNYMKRNETKWLTLVLGIVDYSSNLGEGGGVYVSGASASFERCTFDQNQAEKEGGAVYVDSAASSSFDGCTFRQRASRLYHSHTLHKVLAFSLEAF